MFKLLPTVPRDMVVGNGPISRSVAALIRINVIAFGASTGATVAGAGTDTATGTGAGTVTAAGATDGAGIGGVTGARDGTDVGGVTTGAGAGAATGAGSGAATGAWIGTGFGTDATTVKETVAISIMLPAPLVALWEVATMVCTPGDGVQEK
jgi:hypothetical protein